jgi:hypothetical protein
VIRTLARLAFLIAIPFATWGHIGASTVFYHGNAGPYAIDVIVRPPGVVPGRAEVTVRVESPEVGRVTVQPVRWDAGTKGAPAPDLAQPVRGDATLRSAELWLMDFGSYSIHVAVEGTSGSGKAVVPVMSVATRRLGIDRGLGVLFAGLGLLLFVGALTILGAAAREAVLPPGEVPDAARRARGRRVIAGSALVLALVLAGGRAWWNSVDARYRANMFRPLHITTGVRSVASQRVLRLAIDDPRWLAQEPGRNRFSPLVPDHGKLMHMFLVREPALDAFAHLHPLRLDPNTFDVRLPPLPAGRYVVYADVTHESGYAQTLTDRVDVPEAPSTAAPGAAPEPDPDDSFHVAAALGGAASPAAPLADGIVMVWQQQELVAGQPSSLTFQVRGSDGRPAALEPYMGMLGHMAVRRDDGSVFAHIHPAGSFSMAAQQVLERGAGATTKPVDHSEHAAVAGGTVSFPFEFPQDGRYRLWVQVKVGDRILTAAFDADVAPKR